MHAGFFFGMGGRRCPLIPLRKTKLALTILFPLGSHHSNENVGDYEVCGDTSKKVD